jgi:hypothetical protein
LSESANLVDGAPGAHLAEATRRAIVTPGTVMPRTETPNCPKLA